MAVVEKRIKVLLNGPYEVKGNIPLNSLLLVCNDKGYALRYEETARYAPPETYYLCRCGKSFSKPYCDGTHMQGFDGGESASPETYDEMAEFIPGKQMDLLDAEKLCAIARFCDTKGGTWNLVERSDNPDAKEIIEYQANHCPAGRLTAVTKEGERIEPELPQEISVLEDPARNAEGPLWVKGKIPVEDENGNTYPLRNRVTLCRCGKSANKPLCDGSHLD